MVDDDKGSKRKAVNERTARLTVRRACKKTTGERRSKRSNERK